MIHVHLWGHTEWFGDFAEGLGANFECTQGDSIPIATQILVKGRPTAEDLEAAPELHCVIVPFAGIPPATCSLLMDRPSVALFNLHHNSSDTAEMAIALYLAASKRLIPRDRALRQGHWSNDSFVHGGETSESQRADGKQVLILGYGSIGKRIARIVEAMGMNVWSIRRSGPFEERVRPATELDSLLKKTQALFVALPLTPETDGLMSDVRLALLPDGAVISNIARGAVFNESALYHELASGRLSAGLDVWWNYPMDKDPLLPSQFPFQELDNVVMTPHVGGSSDSSEIHRSQALTEKILAIANGSAKPVSKELGY